MVMPVIVLALPLATTFHLLGLTLVLGCNFPSLQNMFEGIQLSRQAQPDAGWLNKLESDHIRIGV